MIYNAIKGIFNVKLSISNKKKWIDPKHSILKGVIPLDHNPLQLVLILI